VKRLAPFAAALLVAGCATSPDPAGTYVRQISELLPRLAAFHHQYQRYGTSPTLRPVAAMAAPVFEREAAQLRGWRSRR
jgi:hypothetical protein